MQLILDQVYASYQRLKYEPFFLFSLKKVLCDSDCMIGAVVILQNEFGTDNMPP